MIDLKKNDEFEKNNSLNCEKSSSKNDLREKNLINNFTYSYEAKKTNEINGFNPVNFNNFINNNANITNSFNIFQSQNFSEIKNNSNFNNINIITNKDGLNSFPSIISMKGNNNINNQKNPINIYFQNNSFKPNCSNNFQNSMNNINNINNINQKSNIGLNNLIFIPSQQNNFQNNITNIKNINNINNIKIENIIQNINTDFNKNMNNQNNFNNNTTNYNSKNVFLDNLIFNEIEKMVINGNIINPENNNKLNSSKNINQKINPSSFFGGNKNWNKKRNNILKNSKNLQKEIKEKDIRDFKNFCEELKCSLPEYICSQIGSRIMQKLLNRFPPFIITNLIEKIYIDFEKMMCDIYGNYFCQKLYIISSLEQRRMILNSIKDIFINVSKTPSGAHVAQKIIEESSTKDEKLIIMSYIRGHEMELALHQEGTHVLQKIIQIIPENERQNLTDVLCSKNNVNILCKDLKGISVIKRLISFNTDKMNKLKLIESFLENCLEISKTSSGSYIIQYSLEQWGVDIGIKLIFFCIMNFELFATSKHSSNLIDKIIIICLKRYSIIRYFGNEQNINVINNEIIIINALKNIILEPNKIINVYKNKYGKALIMKIRKLLSVEENEKFYLFIKSLENLPNYLESKKYKMYIEIFRSQ